MKFIFKPDDLIIRRPITLLGQKKGQLVGAGVSSGFVSEQSGATTVEFVALLATIISVSITSSTLVGNATTSLGAETVTALEEIGDLARDENGSGGVLNSLGNSGNVGDDNNLDSAARSGGSNNSPLKDSDGSGTGSNGSNDDGDRDSGNDGGDRGARTEVGDGGAHNDGGDGGAGNGGNGKGGQDSRGNPTGTAAIQDADDDGGGGKGDEDNDNRQIYEGSLSSEKDSRNDSGNIDDGTSETGKDRGVYTARTYYTADGKGDSFNNNRRALNVCEQPNVMPDLFEALKS